MTDDRDGNVVYLKYIKLGFKSLSVKGPNKEGRELKVSN